jgi:hypothetical protein
MERKKFARMNCMLLDNVPLPNPFDWDILGRHMFCLGAAGVVGFLIVLIIEYKEGFFRR